MTENKLLRFLDIHLTMNKNENSSTDPSENIKQRSTRLHVSERIACYRIEYTQQVNIKHRSGAK